jgi:hypothetical protein
MRLRLPSVSVSNLYDASSTTASVRPTALPKASSSGPPDTRTRQSALPFATVGRFMRYRALTLVVLALCLVGVITACGGKGGSY